MKKEVTKQKYEHIIKREFRPWYIFYIPVFFYFMWLSIRAKSMTFFVAANPGIPYGGLIAYGKYHILKQFDKGLIPETLYIAKKSEWVDIQRQLMDSGISYPLIIKPDHGRRGFGVKKVDNDEQLQHHIATLSGNFLLQKYIQMNQEFGVLYYRMPGEKKGEISSIMQREFFSVIGDGKSTFATLVKANKEKQRYLQSAREANTDIRETIIARNKKITVMPIGNHCKGTTFHNAQNIYSSQLIDRFDKLANQLDDFYIGRFDLKADSVEDLIAGKVKIMEVNGVEGEPTHVYDPSNTLLSAYKTLFTHWHTIYSISQKNIKRGAKVGNFIDIVQQLRRYFKEEKKGK